MLRLRATFSTSGSSYLNVTLTTVHHLYNVNDARTKGNRVKKGSPYSIAERRVPELIPVLVKRAATSFAAC